jgi:plasmid stabilization system protein ParE
MKVRYTPAAQADVLAFDLYIAADNPGAAQRVED